MCMSLACWRACSPRLRRPTRYCPRESGTARCERGFGSRRRPRALNSAHSSSCPASGSSRAGRCRRTSARPSPFLEAVEACVKLPPLEPRSMLRSRASRRSRAFASRGAGQGAGRASLPPPTSATSRPEPPSRRLVRPRHWRAQPSRRAGTLCFRFRQEYCPRQRSGDVAACPFRYFSQRSLQAGRRSLTRTTAHCIACCRHFTMSAKRV